MTLTDDALQRREVALIAGGGDREGLELLSPLYYLNQALVPTADLIDGTLADVLLANPDVIVLADVAVLTAPEQEAMLTWLDNGGLLLRFAGPPCRLRHWPRRRRPAAPGAPALGWAQYRRRDELGRTQGAGPLCRDLAVLWLGRSR